jgi:O-antigen ligase
MNIFNKKYFKLIILVSHIALGYFGMFPQLIKLFFLGLLIYAIIDVIFNNNKNQEALLWSAYFVGAEVFMRMTSGFVFYETGKIYVILLLILGIVFDKKREKFNVVYVFYILLMLIGIVFTQVPSGESLAKAISFNLSGPISLGIAAIYCYNLRLSNKIIIQILFYSLLPIFSMVTFMYYKTPDLKEIVFGGAANFDTSGGFGPNQVATILGYGIFVLAIFIFLKKKITGFVLLDSLILVYFFYRGLLTFSRGGMFVSIICLFVLLIFISLYKKDGFKSLFKYLMIIGLFVFGAWVYTSGITGGMLDNRYAGRNATGKQKADITSGRIDIFKNQISGFYDAPIFGIGVGNGKYKRKLQGGNVTAASHNELTRLIEEHGLIGVLSLFILLLIPVFHFISGNNYQRGFLISFYLFWFLTINHSAMRIAFPSFIYGLCLIKITDDGIE